MRRRRRLLIVIVAVPVLLILVALLYLTLADLSGWRDTVARLTSRAIGRELRIDGEFEPEIGLTTRVVATDLTLANADWSDEPQMVSVDRLTGEIDLLSILFGPITIRNVEISGARVLFEVDADGHFNWDLGGGGAGGNGGGEVELVIGRALLTHAKLLYSRPQGRALEATLSKLEFTDDGTGMLDLEIDGNLDGTPLEISGTLGTFIGLINAATVRHDLKGNLGAIGFETRGNIADLATLGGTDLTARVHGDHLEALAALLGLAHMPDDTFQTDLTVKPAATGSDLELAASAGDITADVTGTVDSLVKPTALDLTVEASGPDAAQIGSLAGLEDLPEEAFAISGRVRWAGFPLTCDNVKVTVGENSLSAHGVIGEPPLMTGTDFSFEGSGPDISTIAALAGLRAARESYTVTGRLVRLEHGIEVEKIVLRVGGVTLEADGQIGDPPGYEGTALAFHGEGPDLARLQPLVGLELPSEPFEFTGHLKPGERSIDLEDVHARVGDTTLGIAGQIVTEAGFAGTDLRLTADGSNASQVAEIFGVSSVPAEAFHVEGETRVTANGYRIHDAVGSLGSLSLTADGFVAHPPTLVDSDLQIHVEDSNLSHAAEIAEITDLPRVPVTVGTRLRIESAGYRLDDLTATIGDITIAASGLVGAPPGLEGTDIRFTTSGTNLASLEPLVDVTGLPPVSFSAQGSAQIGNAGFVLDGVVAEVDGNRFTLNGTVPQRGLIGTDLKIETSLPDLQRAARVLEGLVALPELPDKPLSASTRFTVDDNGYRVEGLRAALGGATFTVDGRVGPHPDFEGTDLKVAGSGPDVSMFDRLASAGFPALPFHLQGRVEHTGGRFTFHEVVADLGGNRTTVNGSLGEPPKWIGTDLSLRASGPRAKLIGDLAGVPNLPDQPFELTVDLNGTPERFTASNFNLDIGPSDLSGSLDIDITGKPQVEARLKSNRLELPRLRERLEKETASDARKSETTPTGSKPPQRLFNDTPLNLRVLHEADAEVTVRVNSLVLPVKELHDVSLDLHLKDGRFEVERLAATGREEGKVDGSLVLEPVGDRYRLRSKLSASRLRLDLPGSEIDGMVQPPIDIDLDLDTVGASPHDLASSANGSLLLVVGQGVMDSKILDVVTADFLLTLLNAFNPFAKEGAPSELQCGVALLSFVDGLAKLEPMAFQSDKMTLLGNGKIDLRTEKLDLEWVTKPRKGIGISASMITNPYIKLGGTLANPAIELKPLEAVTSTGVAVATMGISLAAKGLFDRITAERKVCHKALKEIDARNQPSGGTPNSRK